METSMGRVDVELYWAHAPRTCLNFARLAEKGYYDGLTFHRVVDGFVAQGGDPNGDGTGGESVYGGVFEDEIVPNLSHVGAGVLSMANSGPNTNGSQFFITLGVARFLDGKHTIFGRVKAGMGVVKKIGKVDVDPDSSAPRDPVLISSATPILSWD